MPFNSHSFFFELSNSIICLCSFSAHFCPLPAKSVGLKCCIPWHSIAMLYSGKKKSKLCFLLISLNLYSYLYVILFLTKNRLTSFSALLSLHLGQPIPLRKLCGVCQNSPCLGHITMDFSCVVL